MACWDHLNSKHWHVSEIRVCKKQACPQTSSWLPHMDRVRVLCLRQRRQKSRGAHYRPCINLEKRGKSLGGQEETEAGSHSKTVKLETEIHVNAKRRRGISSSELGRSLEKILKVTQRWAVAYMVGCRDLLQQNLQWPWRGNLECSTYESFLPSSSSSRTFTTMLNMQGQSRTWECWVFWILLIILSCFELCLRWLWDLPPLCFYQLHWFFPKNLRRDGYLSHRCLRYSGSSIYSDYGMEK